MFDLKGKTALVTGSTQGIGLEIARVLAKCGAKVYVSGSRSYEKCKEISDTIPGSVPTVANLLSDDVADKLYEQTGDVDILVLNASMQYKKAWNEFTIEEYDNQMNCNVRSSYLLIKKYAPAMMNNSWGRIVTIGSVNQYNQHPELSIYAVTKAAQNKMSENFAPILAPHGVTINNVSPGAIATPRNEKVLDNPKTLEAVENSIPCGYVGVPKDIAPTVLLLCSDEGRYITGTDIIIDGGMHLKY